MRASHAAGACPAYAPAQDRPRLRPLCCDPFAAFAAFSRLGGWAPPLPPDKPIHAPTLHSPTPAATQRAMAESNPLETT